MHADFYRVYIKITHEHIKTAIVRANNIKFIKKLTKMSSLLSIKQFIPWRHVACSRFTWKLRHSGYAHYLDV